MSVESASGISSPVKKITKNEREYVTEGPIRGDKSWERIKVL